MAGEKILLPFNFTVYDERALKFVINTFPKREDVKITLFNAYTPLPELDMEASPLLERTKEGMAALSRELTQKEGGLKSAKEFLVENGFADDQVDYVFQKRTKPVADEIIELAAKGRYTVLVLSRHSGKAARMFARSVHDKVLSGLKDITICIAT